MRPHAAEQPRHVGRIGGAAAEQPMPSEKPEVARPRNRHRRRLRRFLLARVGQLVAEERIELARLEAERAEVGAELRQLPELQGEQLAVPAGLLGEPVVGQDVGPLLRLAEVAELDHRHRGEAELACRQHPAVAGDDAVRAVDQHRVGEAVLADRAGDQRHLRLAVGAGVAGVGDQRARSGGTRSPAARDPRSGAGGRASRLLFGPGRQYSGRLGLPRYSICYCKPL